MKDLKDKIKRKINEMLDTEGLTSEDLGHLTAAICMLDENERKKSMSAMSALAGLAAVDGLRRAGDDDED